MVKLNRIYTKTGDNGSTGLGDGSRVRKDDLRVEAYGTVDEANAQVGVCVVVAGREEAGTVGAKVGKLLESIQHDLFDVGADLCCPQKPDEKPGTKLRVTTKQTERLERAIDEHNERLKPLASFVLPGGSALAAALHVARTVSRRAERCVVTLAAEDPPHVNPETVRYLNRLSDLLFVLSRAVNDGGAGDVLWVPGANRPDR
ncbi:MAG: cob(I)yrinic acid a,c-diamide adenosyltransferase [Phycisphaerales bacterium]